MEHLDRLDGKVAIVTGASRRIGRAIALGLAARGADIVVTARVAEEELQAVAREIRGLGRSVTPVLCDLRREEDVIAVVEVAESEHGRLDILVNNAAVRRSRDLLEMDVAEWRDTQSVILEGSFLMCRAAISLMMQGSGGTILSIGGSPPTGEQRGAPTFVPQRRGWSG